MLPYFKSYTIAICAIAVAVPVLTSTFWPLFTGQMMASTIFGMALMFALFIAGLFVGYAIFGKIADSKVQKMLDAYNDDCDPDALVKEGSKIASQISYPCNQAASWFMGYYAQALLDVGETSQAKNVLSGLRFSIDSAKKPAEKAAILVNYLPLCEKMEGTRKAAETCAEGESYCRQASTAATDSFLDFIESQKKILDDLMSSDVSRAIDVCEKIKDSNDYPMRLRVEYAWTEASKLYGSSDKGKEVECLRFIVEHGNKLALVEKAKSRLADI